jgi:GH35 family endo-1,4-beta-xylanase
MVENPERIQKELNFEWDVADKIRVFGREHLLDLASHLETWVHDASLR